MISKFSVKRPYTVVVAIVMVLILGYVSFTRMTTDLFPSLELPYAVVVTTYIGASPEEVESEVTIPIEESMATLNNIKNVSSVSNENYSLVILEFEESTSMDSASLDMRESLDQLESAWNNDMIGSPIIMKINPDMLPIMIAGVENENIDDSTELTSYVEEKILPELQSVNGVASVSMSGGLTESVQVIIRKEKVDALNKKIHGSLDKKFADAEKDIDKAQKDLDKAKDQLSSTQSGLNGTKNDVAGQIGNAQGQLTSQQTNLLKTQLDLEKQLATAQTALTDLTKQKADLENTLSQLKTAKSALENQKKDLEERRNQLATLPAQLESVNKAIGQAENAISMLEEAKATLPGLLERKESLEKDLQAAVDAGDSAKAEEIQTELTTLAGQISAAEAGLSAMGMTSYSESAIDAKIAELNRNLTELRATQAGLQAAVAASDQTENVINEGMKVVDAGLKELDGNIGQIEEGLPQLDAGIAQLNAAIPQLQDGIAQIEDGKGTLAEALGQLNAQGIAGTIDLAVGISQVASGLAQIDSGQAQLDAAKEQLDSSKDDAYDQANAHNILTTDLIGQLLSAQSFSMPAGYITENGTQYLIRVGGKVTSTEELSDLILMDMHMDGVDPIRLSDVAEVLVTDNSDQVYANINGHAGIVFSMEKQTGYATGDVCDNVLKRFAQLEEHEEGVHFITLMNQGVYIDFIVKSVLKNLMYGAVLAILVLILFLKDLKPTMIIAFSIPISVLFCIVLMYFSGITLNIISLSGLALGVGMLVDNSIVVIENIYRLRREGVRAKQAAIEGASQVSGAIIASTLTTICVFAGILFTEGLTRQLFVDLALTIAYALLASLAVAMTLVPMMASRMLKNTQVKEQKFLDKVQNVYGKAIRWCLRFKPVVLLGALALLVVSAVGAYKNGTALFPAMGSNQATVSISVDEDKTLKDLAEAADEVTQRLLKIDGITDVGTTAGSTGGSMSISSLRNSGNTTSATMYLIIDEEAGVTEAELGDQILEATKDMDCEISVSSSSMDMTALTTGGISIRVEGRDLDTLKKTAEEIAAILETVDGTAEVSNGIGEVTPELRLNVDRDKAMEYGLTTAQVFAEVAAKMADAKSAMTLVTQEQDYKVYIMDGETQDTTLEDIKAMTVKGTDKDGKKVDVAIGDIVEFVDAEGMDSISRNNQTRYLNVTAKIAEGHNIGLVANDVNAALADYEVPLGTSWEMAGEDTTINDAFEQILLMLLLALAFMYLIMVAQFQSLLSPFIIMFTVPLAFTGGFLGIILSRSELNMISMVGFVMLSGIIVNNGIVMVDYINQLRFAGMDKKEAIVEAGITRLRPILMTALTTILAMSTMIFSTDMGADMSRSMAVVEVGGLLYGTLLTLFVVPCIYDIFNRNKALKDPLAEAEEDW